MKKSIPYIITLIFLSSCSIQKYPFTFASILKRPEINVSIDNDTCGKITLYDKDKSVISFTFDKQKQRIKHNTFNYLIIKNVNDTNNIISLKKGDTILSFKNTNNVFSKMKTQIPANKKHILWVCGYICVSYHNTISELSGETFTYKSEHRKLKLKFVNDSICTLTNIFDCPDIEQEYKIIVQECTYIKKGNDIYLKNKELKIGDKSYIEIPPQSSNVCDFLSTKNRKRPFYVGHYSATEYEKYGIIPNITIDTLRIINNKIVLYKAYDKGSLGFVFKH
jgi:hypothetical protein